MKPSPPGPAVSAPRPVFSSAQPGGKVLRMVHSDRMAGGIPAWERADTPTQKIESALGRAASRPGEAFGPPSAAAFRAASAPAAENEEFGFGDLLDMVNPLQQLPVIGTIYRSLTGDQIKPAGQIIGGALFGGVLGAGIGIVNVIAEKETGGGLAENALGLNKGNARSAGQNAAPPSYALQAVKPRYNE